MQQEELALAIQQVCEEKGLTPESVKATIEDALAAAYRKDFGDKKTQNIRVKFELGSGEFEVFDVKEVVEDDLKEKYDQIKAEVDKLKEAGEDITPEIMEEITNKVEGKKSKEKGVKSKEDKKEDKKSENEKIEKTTEGTTKKDGTLRQAPLDNARDGQGDSSDEEPEEKKFNPRTMISLSEAKEINPAKKDGARKTHKLGDEVITKLDVPAEFGRMAAQTAKQVIIQKLREAERDTIYNDYKDRVGELIVGTVQRQEGKIVLVDLGSTSAIVLPMDQMRTDKYSPGARMKFYVKSVEQTNKGPEILLSRSHPEVLRKLFKLEVPEINSGAVVIKAIARDAGARSKVAVTAKEEGLDPIGACIGQRGTRVQTIINELGGEKIDVIEWDEDPTKFLANALAPAKILSIKINEAEKTASALVKEDQYSLAIGKGGQNVRLAAQLASIKIDVVMEGGKDSKEKGVKSKEGKEDSKDKEGKDEEKSDSSADEAGKRKVTAADAGQESEKSKKAEKKPVDSAGKEDKKEDKSKEEKPKKVKSKKIEDKK